MTSQICHQALISTANTLFYPNKCPTSVYLGFLEQLHTEQLLALTQSFVTRKGGRRDHLCVPILSDCLEHPGNTADLFHIGVSQHHHHMSDLNSKLGQYFILHTSPVLYQDFDLTGSSGSEMNTKQSDQQAQKPAKDAKLS